MEQQQIPVVHVRAGGDREWSVCLLSRPAGGSISLEHYRARLQSEAIAGHVRLLPGGLCRICTGTIEMAERSREERA